MAAIGDKIKGITIQTLDHFEKIHQAELEVKRIEEEKRMQDLEYREKVRRQEEQQRKQEEDHEAEMAKELQERLEREQKELEEI